MGDWSGSAAAGDVRTARDLFPATANGAYFNSAAVGLASEPAIAGYQGFVAEWAQSGLDFVRAEGATESARPSVARLIGADPSDVALIASVSAAAGFVAAQFGAALRGHNIVIGEREYSSNHFPWRMLEAKGYDVRQVPFRNGGLEPEELAERVDGGTRLVAFSGVQTATGHRSDIASISGIARRVGAIVFVDGAQMVGAMPVADDLAGLDVLVVPDHKFLLNPGRGIGYCYISREMQDRFQPVNAGWKAGAVPLESFFGPEMDLSPTASRFDNTVSWLAAIGHEAALSVFDIFGADPIYERNRQLRGLLASSLAEIGWAPLDLPELNHSTIVSVPVGAADPAEVLAMLHRRRVVAAVRDGNLRLAVHFYNHEDDVQAVVDALAEA